MCSLFEVLALILLAPQAEVPDDVAARFSDPVEDSQAWEMAEAYFGRIGHALSEGDFVTARTWDKRARAHLPDPYGNRLREQGRALWSELGGRQRRETFVPEYAARLNMDLGSARPSDLPAYPSARP